MFVTCCLHIHKTRDALTGVISIGPMDYTYNGVMARINSVEWISMGQNAEVYFVEGLYAWTSAIQLAEMIGSAKRDGPAIARWRSSQERSVDRVTG